MKKSSKGNASADGRRAHPFGFQEPADRIRYAFEITGFPHFRHGSTHKASAGRAGQTTSFGTAFIAVIAGIPPGNPGSAKIQGIFTIGSISALAIIGTGKTRTHLGFAGRGAIGVEGTTQARSTRVVSAAAGFPLLRQRPANIAETGQALGTHKRPHLPKGTGFPQSGKRATHSRIPVTGKPWRTVHLQCAGLIQLRKRFTETRIAPG